MKPRFFVDKPLENNQTIELSEEESHHLSRVLRLSVGDTINIVNGKGGIATAEVVEITKRVTRVRVLEIELAKEVSQLSLAFALPKAAALEFILRRVTELGIAEFQPLETQHSLRHSVWNEDRWQKIIIEVGKQCQEPFFPKLLPPLSLSEWLTKRDTSRNLLFCHEAVRKTAPFEVSGRSDVLVGAEGGWSAEEADKVFAAGAIPLGLGKNRLRAETAALVGITVAKLKLGELV